MKPAKQSPVTPLKRYKPSASHYSGNEIAMSIAVSIHPMSCKYLTATFFDNYIPKLMFKIIPNITLHSSVPLCYPVATENYMRLTYVYPGD